MFKFYRSVLAVIAVVMAMAVFHPVAAHASVVQDTIQVPVGDTAHVSVVLPKCESLSLACVAQGLIMNQTALVMLITTLLLGWLSLKPWFADFGDLVKILVHFVAQFVISWGALSLGHQSLAPLAALISATIGGIVSWFIFQKGKTQPSTAAQAIRAQQLRAS
jgi:hypothetical protein